MTSGVVAVGRAACGGLGGGTNSGPVGAGSPRSAATSSRSRRMITSVTSRSDLAATAASPSYAKRSIGAPAETITGVRGRSLILRVIGLWMACAPHCAIGMTGAPVISASRAAPVLPCIGQRSGSFVQVPSG